MPLHVHEERVGVTPIDHLETAVGVYRKFVPFMFASRYLASMRDRQPIRTREDLLRLIAQAVQLQMTYLGQKEALAVADTVLRSFKAAGLSIRRRREDQARNESTWSRKV